MRKIDLKNEEKYLYNPSKSEFQMITVPPMNFLMIDGAGDPNTSQTFQEAVQALYGLSYTLKFMSKREMGIDYTVLPLEGLWWAEELTNFDLNDKSNWLWTVMIRQPDHINKNAVGKAMEEVKRKKNPIALSKLRFEAYNECLCAQIMHIGPYSEEGPVIARMHDFIRSKGYQLAGKHHEIYLSDPNRTTPEKMRTILRQPAVKTQ